MASTVALHTKVIARIQYINNMNQSDKKTMAGFTKALILLLLLVGDVALFTMVISPWVGMANITYNLLGLTLLLCTLVANVLIIKRVTKSTTDGKPKV